MDQEDSWNPLTPGIVHQDRPAVFGPKDVSPVAVHFFPGCQDAGMYTRSELSSFWYSILIGAASRNTLKVLTEALCSFKQQQELRQLPVLCSSHRLLCGQHDLTWLLQRSILGYVWISCLCS